MNARAFVGTAGWAVPSPHAERFGDGASTLARYATRFDAIEINSSFHRPHKRATYERWAATVPAAFRFSVKLPKTITHERRLVDIAELLVRFADEAAGLADKLAVILVQLPPSFAFDAALADAFFPALRDAISADIAIEPRHATWFEDYSNALLVHHRIARVAADPARVPIAAEPGGWDGFAYYRLHGSPAIYRSVYSDAQIAALAAVINPGDWCIFDNTMSYGATSNALDLSEALAARSGRGR